MDGDDAAPYQLSKLDVSNSVSSSEEGCISDSDDNEENAVETSMDYHDAREYPEREPEMDGSTVDSAGEILSDGPENETDYYMDQDMDYERDNERERHRSQNGMPDDYAPITVTQTADGRTVSKSPRPGAHVDNRVSDKGCSSGNVPDCIDSPDPVPLSDSHEVSPGGGSKKLSKTHNKKSPARVSMQDKLNLSFSKSSMHDDHLELDYEEDLETEVQKKGEGEEVMDKDDDNEEEGEIESEEEGEATSGDDDRDHDTDGEIVDDDCEEGEIKDREPSEPRGERGERDTESPQPQQQQQQPPQSSYQRVPAGVCRFFLRGNCTWGGSCRFIHPGYDDKGPPGGMGGGGGYRRNARPWISSGRGVPEPDIPPPVRPVPAQESAWERGLRQAKELKLKAQKRKETDADFEEKRKNLTIEEDKDFNKENERTQMRDPYYDNIFEEDDYIDRQAQDAWHEGQYENFEVRWTREPPNFRYRDKPVYRERFPDKDMYSPEKRFDKRKGEPLDRYKKSKEINPSKGKGQDEWHDPWSRSNKSPPKKRRRSSSRSRSRGRRKHRSYSKGSHSSSGSSSSYTSRSRSRSRASSYSSYSSRSSYSRSSSYSSRSSSRSNSRSRSPPSPHPKTRKTTNSANPNNKKLTKAASAAKSGELPRSTVSKLPVSQASQQGTLKALLGQQRRHQESQKAPAQRGPPGPQKGPQWNKGIHQRVDRRKLGLPPLEPNGARAPPYSAPPPMSKAAHLERLRTVADTGRLKAKEIPKRSKPGRTYSSSDSSRSRSRSTSSHSRSSSASSYSSSSSSTSSGSADSEHLYRKIRGRHSSASSRSPSLNTKKERAKDKTLGKELEKKKRELEKIKEQERIRELERAKELEMSKDLDRVREPQKEVTRPKEKETKKVTAPGSRPNAAKSAQARPESRSRAADQRAAADGRLKSQVSTGRPASVTTVGSTKDPMKMTGQKSGIKLTLKSEKRVVTNPAKKRSAPSDVFAAPAKKVVKVSQPDSKSAKTEKPAKVATAKAAPAKSKSDLPKSPVKAVPKAPAAVAPPVLKKKSSTSSRREELLKQLKAVEDAILRKRSKIT